MDNTRNRVLLLLEGIFFMVGLVFFDANTILPLLIKKLTGSEIMVGVLGMAPAFSLGITSFFAGNYVRPLTYKKKFMLTISSAGRLPLWILALSLIFLTTDNPIFWSILIIGIQFLFWFADGAVYTAWTDLIGKSLNPNSRGRFFGLIQIIAGIFSIFAGGLISKILGLESLKFPINYGVILLIGAFLYTLSIIMFAGVKEEPSITSKKESIRNLFIRIPEYFRSSKPFTMAMGSLFLATMGTIALPFYIVYGESNFGLAAADIGILISMKIIGKMVGGALFGFVGDKMGHEKGIKFFSISTLLPPLLAIFTVVVGFSDFIFIIFCCIYFFIGMYTGGGMVFMNYMIDLIPADQRTLFAGLLNVVRTPAAVAPVIGGIIVTNFSYLPVFIFALIFTLMGTILAFFLPSASRTETIPRNEISGKK